MSKYRCKYGGDSKPKNGETHQTIIQRRRQLLQIQPNIKRGSRGDVNIQTNIVQALEDVIAFGFEVFLQSDFLFGDVGWLYEVDGCKLHAVRLYVN